MKKFNGRKLKEIRLAQGLKQYEIVEKAAELGCVLDSRTLSHWEISGAANPRRKNLLAVAEVLGIDDLEQLYIQEDGDGSVEQDAVPKGPMKAPHRMFWESLGFVLLDQEDGTWILRSAGRRKDLTLSDGELEGIHAHVTEYCEFILDQHLKRRKQ